jgi:hypothetical protein
MAYNCRMASVTSYYANAAAPVRADIIAQLERVLQHLATPGSWYSGAERLAIAKAAREARDCRLCQARKDALSPLSVQGEHDHDGDVPDIVIEAVHRIVTDQDRLGESWFQGLMGRGLTPGRYVEIVGVMAHTVSIDTFARAMGLAPLPLPEPVAGGPSGYVPACVTPGPGWVATIAKDNASGPEADIYDGMMGANIQRALTLVPVEKRSWSSLAGVQYLPQAWMRDFSKEYRAINHAQIEFLAARVSALNRCIY